MKNNFIKAFLLIHFSIIGFTLIDNLGVNFSISSNVHIMQSDNSITKSGQMQTKCFMFWCNSSATNLDGNIHKSSYYQYKIFNKMLLYGDAASNNQLVLNDNIILGLNKFRVIDFKVIDFDTVIILRLDATTTAFSAKYHGTLSSFSKLYQ